MTAAVQEEKQIDQLWVVKKSYWTGFFGSIGVVLLGLLASFLINEFYPFADVTIRLWQAFSVVPGSATLFAVQGWDIQTFGGRSPAEFLNQKLFTCFSLVGLFLPVVAFSLHSAVINEVPFKVEDKVMQKLKSDILRELAMQNSISSTFTEVLPKDLQDSLPLLQNSK